MSDDKKSEPIPGLCISAAMGDGRFVVLGCSLADEHTCAKNVGVSVCMLKYALNCESVAVSGGGI